MLAFHRTNGFSKSMICCFSQQDKERILHLRNHHRRRRPSILLLIYHSCCTNKNKNTTTASRRTISTISVQEVQFVNSGDDDEKHIQSKLADIIRPYHKEQKPVVVRSAVSRAPATTLWSSLEYWQEVIGRETDEISVSVEMGSSYSSANSERAEIPFSAFLHFLQLFEERHGQTGSLDSSSYSTTSSPIIPTNELVYMAQNDLLPSLYKDVIIPDFCCEDDKNKENNNPSSTVVGYGRLYSVMMWLGSRGCVSPLHFDPLDNCFMQHHGRKRVLLFSPSSKSESESTSFYWHYAGHEGQQYNTSPINPEILDWKEETPTTITTTSEQNQQQDDSSNSYDNFSSYSKKYPLFFEDAPSRLECFLQPGDLLYIPKKCWHHVRSIDTSTSVNVWWR